VYQLQRASRREQTTAAACGHSPRRKLIGLSLLNPDNSTFTLGVEAIATEASNGSGATTSSELSVTIGNINPTAALANSLPEVVRGQNVIFTLTATDPSATDRTAGFKYIINWGDGSPLTTILPTANNGQGISANHIFTATGTYVVTLTAADKDGTASSSVTESIKVAIVALETDPTDPTRKALFVGGTTGKDVIQLLDASKGQAQVKVGGASQGVFASPSQIIVFAQAGDDSVTIAGSLKIPAQVYGGDGNDSLTGGGGGCFLFGEAGDDFLTGGPGHSILIGGTGADRLVGASGDSILIAGTTAYDSFPANQTALRAIGNAWNTAAPAPQRIAALSAGVGTGGIYRLCVGTVFNDSAHDKLTGASGFDWFLISTGDVITDKPEETLLL
jgi:PKD repeat protein